MHSFYRSDNRIPSLIIHLVSKMMNYSEDIDFETFIEDQENKGPDFIYSEMDCSLPKLSSLLIQ